MAVGTLSAVIIVPISVDGLNRIGGRVALRISKFELTPLVVAFGTVVALFALAVHRPVVHGWLARLVPAYRDGAAVDVNVNHDNRLRRLSGYCG